MLSNVLDWIDTNLPASLDRLFDLLRIESISTDPAYAPSCRKAAEWLAADLGDLGFDASIRQTPGHPIVVGHPAATVPTSCSPGITTCSRSIPSSCGRLH